MITDDHFVPEDEVKIDKILVPEHFPDMIGRQVEFNWSSVNPRLVSGIVRSVDLDGIEIELTVTLTGYNKTWRAGELRKFPIRILQLIKWI